MTSKFILFRFFNAKFFFKDLLWRAAVVELNKEKEQHRIDYHTTRMFPEKKDAPDHNTWLSEMSEGVDVLGRRGAPAPAGTEGKRVNISNALSLQFGISHLVEGRL